MSNIIPIQDFSAPELDVYARLTENQLVNREHPTEGLFIAESPKVIARALDAGCVPVSALVEAKHVAGEAAQLLTRCGDIPVYTAEFDVLSQLTGFPLTRGLLCAMYRPPLPALADICRNARRVAVLGMDAVLLTPACSDPLYRRAIRVSMGTVFQVPWTWLEGGIEEVKSMGFETAAMALEERSISLRDSRLSRAQRLAIFLGSEGDGLNPATISQCDYTVMIPMTHGVDSLNVAAASAVAFWALGSE